MVYIAKCQRCGRGLGFLQSGSYCNSCQNAIIHETRCERQYQQGQDYARNVEMDHMSNELERHIAQYPQLASLRGTVTDYVTLKWAYYRAYSYANAKNLETAGRYEESARVYEELGMFKEAGGARSKANTQTIKHVNVNLNDLIDKLRYGGLAIPYKCSSCGGTIVIDKNSHADGLQACSFCGSALNTDALTRILQDAVGH